MTENLPPENLFNGFGNEYDRMISWEARLEREGPFLQARFREYNVRSVLDAACGTGRHALLFATWGLAVTGADLSPTMVETARALAVKQGLPVRFVQAGFGSLAGETGAQYDAVVCLGNSLPHLRNSADLQTALADFCRALRPGGVLVLQNRNYDRILAEKSRFMPLNQYKKGKEETLYLRITDFPVDDQAGHITFNIVVMQKDAAGIWSYRAYAEELQPWRQAELAAALGAAGFKKLRHYGDYSGAEYIPETSTDLIIVAEK